MAFRVELTSRAIQDLDVILEWLVGHEAGETGLRWFEKMREAVVSLADYPYRCSLAPESREFPFEVHQLLYGKKRHAYRILFAIEAETVIVLHVRHGRQQPLSGQRG